MKNGKIVATNDRVPSGLIQKATPLFSSLDVCVPDIEALPAKISMGGIIWASPLPENREHADYYNAVAESLCQSAKTEKEQNGPV